MVQTHPICSRRQWCGTRCGCTEEQGVAGSRCIVSHLSPLSYTHPLLLDSLHLAALCNSTPWFTFCTKLRAFAPLYYATGLNTLLLRWLYHAVLPLETLAQGFRRQEENCREGVKHMPISEQDDAPCEQKPFFCLTTNVTMGGGADVIGLTPNRDLARDRVSADWRGG